MTDEQELRKSLLNPKKSERIIFAVSPELKEAATEAARDDCVSLSAYITALMADDVVARRAASEGEGGR